MLLPTTIAIRLAIMWCEEPTYVLPSRNNLYHILTSDTLQVTLEMYAQAKSALSQCDNGGGICNLYDFFDEYHKNGNNVVPLEYGKLSDEVNRWQILFFDMDKKVTAVKTVAQNVQKYLATAKSQIDAKKKSICANNACSGPQATAFLKQGM